MPTDRYSRQRIVPEIGTRGQRTLSRSSVFVVGCGGLGSALLYDLACMGIGRIGFADADAVSESDLNRQFLHTAADIGRPKTDSALQKLFALNPTLSYAPHETFLTDANADALLTGYDVIVLAVDNLAARFCANAWCVRAGVPLVDGGVNGFSGSMTAVFPARPPCLRCLYGQAKDTARTIGSFAPVVTAVSALEAQAAALLLLGRAESLYGKLFLYDGASLTLASVDLRPSPGCPACGHLITEE